MVYPRVLTKHKITETVLPQSTCGQNWYYSVNVRNPYQGWDKHSRTLPALGEKKQIADREEGLIKQFDDERKRVKNLRSQHAGALSSSQKSNIDKYLNRALEYLEDARYIEMGWRNGFSAINYGSVKPFPIYMEYGDIANGFCVGKYGHKSTNIYEPNCPTKDEMIGHNLDSEKWVKLMVAAVINTRCAEEVIRKAEVKEANKQSKPNTLSIVPGAIPPKPGVSIGMKPVDPVTPYPGIGLSPTVPGSPTPMPTIPAPTQVNFQPIEPVSGEEPSEEPVIPLDEGDEEIIEEGGGVLEGEALAPKAAKKKKKSNVPLIAAAGIGALLLLR